MSESHFRTFVRGSAVTIIGTGLLGVINYLIRRCMALNMPEVEYGFFYSVMSMVMLSMSFMDMGLGQSSQILIAQAHGAEDTLRANRCFSCFFYIKLAAGLIAFIVFISLCPVLSMYFFKYPEGTAALAVMLFLVIVQPMEGVMTSGLAARKFFFARNMLMVMKSLLILLLLIIFGTALVHASLYYVICGILLAACGFWVIIRKTNLRLVSPRSLGGDDIRGIFSLSVWVAVSTAGISSIYYLDTLCLTLLRSLDEVAIYNIALPLMQIAQCLMIFPVVFTPIAAEMWAKGDRRGILKIWEKVTLLMLLVLPFLVLTGVFGGKFIITLLFSEKFVSAAPVMTVLWAGMVFFSIAGFNMTVLNSAGKQKKVALMVCGGCLMSIALNCALIPFFGALGASIANLIVYLVLAVATGVLLVRIIRGTDEFGQRS